MNPKLEVALLTGGGDRPYAFGLATALMSKGVRIDLIAGDELDGPEFHGTPFVRFLNLRGDQQSNVGLARKMSRVLVYYGRLIRYALSARPRVFHILWNNKFEVFDRTLLMLYYKVLGKRLTITVHNVNAGARDANDTALNRLTLGIQYRLADHIFVHTKRMKNELVRDFRVCESRVSVIPFGINNAVPCTDLTADEARRRLGLSSGDRTLLFFGNIAPYKGLEYLVDAFHHVAARGNYRLVIAGRPRPDADDYWNALRTTIDADVRAGRIITRIEFVPDVETEVYFKAADVVVLPYTEIFQSGVLFLGYSFGLPVIAADVGSMREDIIEGKTGFVFAKKDSASLATAIESYFASDVYACLRERRQEIRDYATRRHSWDTVSQMTTSVYQHLIESPS